MQIDIPSGDVAKLTSHAQAAGFADVESYVRHFIAALAHAEDANKLFPLLTESDLADSLAMIDQGMDELQSGEGASVSEARQRAHQKLRANH